MRHYLYTGLFGTGKPNLEIQSSFYEPLSAVAGQVNYFE